MKKKDYYFSLYVKNELENDIEIISTFDTFKDLEDFLEVSKAYLCSLGVKKQNNLRLNINIKGKEYVLIVDRESWGTFHRHF